MGFFRNFLGERFRGQAIPEAGLKEAGESVASPDLANLEIKELLALWRERQAG